MNTYIGLLGELYTEAVQKKNQILGKKILAYSKLAWSNLE